ncbi:MAG: hypothetical protein WKF59_17465 [Chitinophagaceae bacterium]
MKVIQIPLKWIMLTIEHPDNWEWGKRSNTQMVLKGLKAYENGNIEEAVKDFADSVKLEFDHFETKVSKDSLVALFKRSRSEAKSMTIKMEDFESVKSKDGKEEYVSLWYKQLWEDQKGNKASVVCMDDMKIENGKIALLSQKVRHFWKQENVTTFR